MKTITLRRGEVALVDDEDYVDLARFKWYANRGYPFRHSQAKAPPVAMHRQIMNPPAGMEVDHINGNKLDNRRQNLRLATRRENMRNTKVYNRQKRYSQFKCVTWIPKYKRWMAYIALPKHTTLGYHGSEVEAAIAYDLAALKHFGEFARPNFQTIKDYINATKEH